MLDTKGLIIPRMILIFLLDVALNNLYTYQMHWITDEKVCGLGRKLYNSLS